MSPDVHHGAVYNSQGMKQPRRPPTEEWVKMKWCMSTMEYYSALKKEAMPPGATWTDPEIIILSDVSQTEKDNCLMTSLLCRV